MSVTLYGISNCDTVKKARAWLDGQGVGYTFHDFKKAGVPQDRLADWSRAVGWEKLVNRQGTTWRKLDAAQQAGVRDDASARALMLAQPSVIKRPVVEWPGGATTRLRRRGLAITGRRALKARHLPWIYPRATPRSGSAA